MKRSVLKHLKGNSELGYGENLAEKFTTFKRCNLFKMETLAPLRFRCT